VTNIEVRGLMQLQRGLTLFATRQLPQITALALNDIAQQVADGEMASMPTFFDRPTPFVQKSVRVGRASPYRPWAKVFVMDKAAVYLEPFEFGGKHAMGTAPSIVVPAGSPPNAYGNLPRGRVGSFKGKKNVFTGAVRTKSGKVIVGIWQRPNAPRTGRKSSKRGTVARARGPLKLLVDFAPNEEVRQHWGYFDRARQVVERCYRDAFERAVAQVMKG
jgi:hypothetical protein